MNVWLWDFGREGERIKSFYCIGGKMKKEYLMPTVYNSMGWVERSLEDAGEKVISSFAIGSQMLSYHVGDSSICYKSGDWSGGGERLDVISKDEEAGRRDFEKVLAAFRKHNPEYDVDG